LERIADIAQTIAGFPGAKKVLGTMLPVKMTLRQIWEQALRIGADLVVRREEDVQRMLNGVMPVPPQNAPDLLVISPDGGRLQDRLRAIGERWCEYKAVVLYRVTRPEEAREGARGDPQRLPHWRYVMSRGKAGGGYRPVKNEKAKRYADPEPETKTFTATTKTVERFPLYVELEARRRGLMEAHTVAVVGDGGDFIWRTAREVCETRVKAGKHVFEILDIIHAGTHLINAAKAAYGATKEGATWVSERFGELWRGERDALVAALETHAARLGPRPACGSIDQDNVPPVVTAWRARDYFEEHRERIRYDVFRRYGLPLTSPHIESAIKQTNHRVKGSEKQWLLEHAEEMLQLRCLALSQDDRWPRHFGALRAGESVLPTHGRVRHAAPPSPEPATKILRRTPTSKAS
jgi:hypothetical protein